MEPESKVNLVAVNLDGVVYYLTEEEFNDLMNGYLNRHDMFE